MTVPYIFGTQTQVIPLSQLDQNFATPITLGNVAAHLGDTVNLAAATGVTGRNRIINGDFRLATFNAGSFVTTSNYYLDRWFITAASAGNAIYQTQQASSMGTQLAMQTQASITSAAGDQWALQQPIEANYLTDILFGSPGARALTLSFKVNCSDAAPFTPGLWGGSITNFAGTRSYPFTYTIPGNNTFYNIAITIPGDTAGTWVADGVAGAMRVYFDLGCGSNFAAPAGAWTNGNYLTAPGTVKFVSQTGVALYLTDIQLELAPPGATPANPIATAFDRRPFGTELALCYRYRMYNVIQGLWNYGSGTYFTVPFPVTMRANPTMLMSAGYGAGPPILAQTSINQVIFQGNPTGANGFQADLYAEL